MTGTRFKPYPETKDSGIEWLGLIPAHWQVRRLRHCALLNPTKREVTGLPRETEVSFLPMPKVSERGELALDETKELAAVIEGYTYFRDGDVLLAKITPCFENGKAAVAAGLAGGFGFGSTEFHVLRPQPESDGRFLYYAVFSDPFRKIGTTHMVGAAGQQRVPEQFLFDWRQPIPGLAEQQSIADFLDRGTAKIDALVEKKERLIELLQEKRIALITHAVTKGLDPNLPMKDSGIEWLGEIPAQWELKPLKRVAGCLDGQRVPVNAEERALMQGEYTYWGANGILDYVDGWLFDEPLVLLGEDGAPFFEPHKPVSFYVHGKIWVNNHAHVLRPTPGVVPQFLPHVLNTVDYRTFIGGATRDKLTQDDMRDIPIQLPDEKEQQAIADFLDCETAKIDALIDKIQEAIERLKEYRIALISAAVTGKIDLREEVLSADT